MKKLIIGIVGIAVIGGIAALILKVVFRDPHVTQGRVVFEQYCAGCHGVKGRGNGFNAVNLDPYPRDLTDSVEPYMAEGTNQQIFSAIATGVAGSAPPMEGLHKHIHHHGGGGGEMEGMQGMEGMAGMDHEAGEEHQHEDAAGEEPEHDQGDGHDEHDMAGMSESDHQDEHVHADGDGQDEHADGDGNDEEMAMDMPMDAEAEAEAGGSPQMPYWGFTLSDLEMWELVAFIRTLHKNDQPPVEFDPEPESNRRRPEYNKDVRFPPLDSSMGKMMAERGKKLAGDKYACTACHTIGEEGGHIGPYLDRSGIRLNPKWIYRWIQDPQSFRKDTKMPAFGMPEKDAVAITLYLMTLRAPAVGPQ